MNPGSFCVIVVTPTAFKATVLMLLLGMARPVHPSPPTHCTPMSGDLILAFPTARIIRIARLYRANKTTMTSPENLANQIQTLFPFSHSSDNFSVNTERNNRRLSHNYKLI